jgi:MSHA pilin protein MshA
MKRSAGFTLIELVIVIIILGILAVTAAPKFLNLQGDARESTLKGMKAAMESASSLVYSKAVIQGTEGANTGTTKINASTSVTTVYGYPQATSTELEKVVELSSNDWEWGSVTSGAIPLYPAGVSASFPTCFVQYAQPSASGARPTITISSSAVCG